MIDTPLYLRFLQPRLIEAMADTPVVLIHGPRQCGKSTLARQVGDAAGYTYLSFDDDVQRASAQADPIGYVADLPDKVVLDEVQRVPNLFTSLKAAVDARRQPGRFILTGSANVLLVPKLADSLVGRMDILRLHPLAQAELAGTEPNFLSALFGNAFKTGACGQRLVDILLALSRWLPRISAERTRIPSCQQRPYLSHFDAPVPFGSDTLHGLRRETGYPGVPRRCRCFRT